MALTLRLRDGVQIRWCVFESHSSEDFCAGDVVIHLEEVRGRPPQQDDLPRLNGHQVQILKEFLTHRDKDAMDALNGLCEVVAEYTRRRVQDSYYRSNDRL